MDDKEKVIKGLEICSAGELNSTGGRDHTDCPYYPAGYTGCTCKLLMRDALALLKEQEAEIRQLRVVLDIVTGTCKVIESGGGQFADMPTMQSAT